MHNMVVRGSQAVLCALLLFCLGCSPAGGTGPTTYNRIVLETYDPAGNGLGAPNSNTMELWSSDGKTMLTSDDGGISSRPPGPSQGYAYIDHNGSLVSGDYYVLVYASLAGDSLDYGIRVLTAPSTSYAGWNVTAPAEIVTDSPPAGGGGIPATAYTIVLNDPPNDRIGRHIVANGVNWIKLTLP